MRKSSFKQIKAMQLRANGLSKRQSLIQAGYSISTANQAKRVFKTEGMLSLMDNFQNNLLDAGLTSEYWTRKIKEWSESENPKVQQEAYNFWLEVMNNLEARESNNPSRKIVFEEWLKE
jgi:hypothetical protein